jgi:hypothetical protein
VLRYTCCQNIWYTIFHSTAGQPGLGDVCDALSTLVEMRRHSSEHRFGRILSKFMHRHCSDPHDKIYGLLGIAGEKEAALIIPDYSKPVEQLYEELAVFLVETTGELDILSMRWPEAGGETSVVQGLPSWVPNWTLDTDASLLYDLDDRLSWLSKYKASKDSHANIELPGNGKLLTHGRILGRIELVSKYENHVNAPSLVEFFNSWKDMLGVTASPGQLYANHLTTTLSDAYWQILCCGVLPDRSEPRNENLLRITSDDSPLKLWFDAWWEWCEKYDCDSHELMVFQSNCSRAEIDTMGGLISTSISLRRAFVSDGVGWRGLVPMDAEVGDLIVLLKGGRVPYILRPIENGNTSVEYRMVGDTYVHGIMDGSEWNESELEDMVLT